MSPTIYCEGALFGPLGREIDHPNYERISIPVDVKNGYHGTIRWTGLGGVLVESFRLIIGDAVLSEKPAAVVIGDDGYTVSVPIEIPGKGYDPPDIIVGRKT